MHTFVYVLVILLIMFYWKVAKPTGSILLKFVGGNVASLICSCAIHFVNKVLLLLIQGFSNVDQTMTSPMGSVWLFLPSSGGGQQPDGAELVCKA